MLGFFCNAIGPAFHVLQPAWPAQTRDICLGSSCHHERRKYLRQLSSRCILQLHPFRAERSQAAMSFVAPPPAATALRRSAFLPARSIADALPRGAPRPSPPVRNDAVASAPEWLRSLSHGITARAEPGPCYREFRTMSPAPEHPDHAALDAVVVQVAFVCPARDHVQLTLDVSRAGLCEAHVAPGQFVQLSRGVSHFFSRKKGVKSCFATIASPPGGNNGHFEFLVSPVNDPLKLAALKPGDKISISPVMGEGLDYLPVVNSKGNLYIFADAPQGFAAAKSLVEWSYFRSASGEGANRTNRITIYYAVPTARSLPYGDRLSAWSVFGVNIVPLPGVSVLEYMSTRSSIGSSAVAGADDFAMACVCSNDTYEALFNSLVLFGFRRSAVRRFTQEVVANEVEAYDDSEDFEVPSREHKPHGMPEDMYEDMKRYAVERQVWESWVRVREGMRAEFERKWANQARMYRDSSRAEAEKHQAWASWCARNSAQWSQVAWDNDQWSQYWSSWSGTQETWTDNGQRWQSHSAWGSSGGGGGSQGSESRTWSQQGSQEYWDWVGRGVGKGPSSASGRRASKDWTDDSTGWYDRNYGGSGSWGNANNRWSGYQKGGYRYQYEEPKKDAKDHNGYSGGSTSGGWSGWNRGGSGRRSSSTGGQRSWGSTGSRGRTSAPSFGEMDFYAVLGIGPSASRAEIKRAYRRMAMKHHPDRNPERSEEAHVKMKQIVVAWSVLKDEGKRQRYDQHGSAGL